MHAEKWSWWGRVVGVHILYIVFYVLLPVKRRMNESNHCIYWIRFLRWICMDYCPWSIHSQFILNCSLKKHWQLLHWPTIQYWSCWQADLYQFASDGGNITKRMRDAEFDVESWCRPFTILCGILCESAFNFSAYMWNHHWAVLSAHSLVVRCQKASPYDSLHLQMSRQCVTRHRCVARGEFFRVPPDHKLYAFPVRQWCLVIVSPCGQFIIISPNERCHGLPSDIFASHWVYPADRSLWKMASTAHWCISFSHVHYIANAWPCTYTDSLLWCVVMNKVQQSFLWLSAYQVMQSMNLVESKSAKYLCVFIVNARIWLHSPMSTRSVPNKHSEHEIVHIVGLIMKHPWLNQR